MHMHRQLHFVILERWQSLNIISMLHHTSTPPWVILSSGGLMVIQSRETVMEMSPAQT
jgi:hypothetical protein